MQNSISEWNQMRGKMMSEIKHRKDVFKYITEYFKSIDESVDLIIGVGYN